MPKAKIKDRTAKAIKPRGRRRKASVELVELPPQEILPEDLGVAMPDPHAFLSDTQNDGSQFKAAGIYAETWAWLNKKGCADFVSQHLLERYAVSVARWMQCEEMINRLGMLSKHPTTGKPVASPFVEMGIDYLAQSEKLWNEIVQIVKAHGSGEGETPDSQDDIMGRLL